jgi:hypothetical protein
MGNAWFVSDVLLAANAAEELAALGSIDPRTTAIVDRRFAESIPAKLVSAGGVATQAQSATQCDGEDQRLNLVAYEANALTFEAATDAERLAVFSDIWYPGWQCTIDGQPAEVLRADYVLRAVVIPAGKHTIAFRFDPQSLHATEAVANGALILLAVLLVALIAFAVYRRRR